MIERASLRRAEASATAQDASCCVTACHAPVLRLPLLRGFVYAPTAAVIHQFCQLARHSRTTRVAHFEQPVFAWR